jgi:hypothetical protein
MEAELNHWIPPLLRLNGFVSSSWTVVEKLILVISKNCDNRV